MKCNNCVKNLTCNREICKQVTYLQAGQIDKLEIKKEKKISRISYKIYKNFK